MVRATSRGRRGADLMVVSDSDGSSHHPPSTGHGVSSMTEKKAVSRRGFLETAGLATGAVAASASNTFAHPAIGAKGANEKITFAVLGPGGRAQAHIKVL